MELKKLGTFAFAALLAVAACQPGARTGSPPAQTGGTQPSPTGGGQPTAPDESPGGGDGEFGTITIGPDDPIRLGTALVISTADADLGQDSQYGALAASQLIDNTLLDHPIEWNHQDETCSAEGGTAAARALVADPQIVAVIGTSCSSAGIPAAEITSDAGVLMVSPSNTAPSLTHPDSHEPFYARTAHNDEVQGEAMATFACDELDVTRVATVHDGSPYSQQLQQVMADRFAENCEGGEVVAQEAVAPTDTDMTTVLTTIAARDPELIYYPIFTAGGAIMTQQARQNADLEGVHLAGADGMQSQNFLEAAGDAANDIYASGPDLAFEGGAYEEEFLPAYYELCNCEQTTSVFHAHAFDAANMIFQAIEQVAEVGEDGTLTIDRGELRDAFFGFENYEGVTGTLTCDENGDCADPAISVSQVQDGEFVRIWPED